MAQRGRNVGRDSGQNDKQQVFLIRRVVAIAAGVLVLVSCCLLARATVSAISSVRQELAAKAKPAPKVQRLKPKSKPKTAPKQVVAWQPSHQDDTGNGEWHEYQLAGYITGFAMKYTTKLRSVEAWDISDGLSGSNSEPSNLVAFDKELAIANAAKATYFISVHIGNDGESGVKGFYMPGDRQSKVLSQRLVASVAAKTGLPSKGVEEQKLYSLEAGKNKAKYRVLIEIGGSDEDVQALQEKKNQSLAGQAMADVLNGLAP